MILAACNGGVTQRGEGVGLLRAHGKGVSAGGGRQGRRRRRRSRRGQPCAAARLTGGLILHGSAYKGFQLRWGRPAARPQRPRRAEGRKPGASGAKHWVHTAGPCQPAQSALRGARNDAVAAHHLSACCGHQDLAIAVLMRRHRRRAGQEASRRRPMPQQAAGMSSHSAIARPTCLLLRSAALVMAEPPTRL